MRTGCVIVTSACVVAACGVEPAAEGGAAAPGQAVFDDAARAAVVAAVDSATRSFHAAEVARDGEAVVAHLAPDFTMIGDGARAGYDAAAEGIRSSMPNLTVFHAEWTELEIRALGPTSAVASFLFRDSTVTRDGDITVQRGPSTLVWEKRGEDWLIVYVDADHYPPE